jgi:hypothetical protein
MTGPKIGPQDRAQRSGPKIGSMTGSLYLAQIAC